MTELEGTLVLGWGNPGRRDDGLGQAFAEAVERLDLDRVEVDYDYQLHVEDAAEVARHRQVLFVDADRAGPAPFRVEPLSPSDDGLSFSTHSVTPGALLALTRDLFDAEPRAWLMGIRGYDFEDFGEGLSAGAAANLEAAVGYLRDRAAASGLELPSSNFRSNIEAETCPTTSR